VLSSPHIQENVPASPIYFFFGAFFSPHILDSVLVSSVYFPLSALSSLEETLQIQVKLNDY
jgi:hypothetical protein